MGPPPRKPLNALMSDVMAAAAIPEDVAPVEPEPEPNRPVASATEIARPIPDGRSLRATGRTHQFATRIKEETHSRIKQLALDEKITIGELLEWMVEDYKPRRKKSSS